MKKRFLLILLLYLSAVFFLSGCYSLTSESFASVPENTLFTSYAVSSNFGNIKIDSQATVLLIFSTDSYYNNRILEQAVSDELTKYGFSVLKYSDWDDITYSGEIKLFSLPHNNWRYGLEFSFSDLYTYEIGGGISNLQLQCSVYDSVSSSYPIKISVSSESNKNNYLSFNSSLPLYAKSMAKALVAEYMKYL